jgi:polysaccharide biosynthesis/export protein
MIWEADRHIARVVGLALFALLFAATAFARDDAYRIGPRDVLGMTVFAGGERQIEQDMTVSGDGTVNAPLVGSLPAAGLTATELEERFREILADGYFVEPEVTVRVKGYHSLRYYIAGAVNRPGLYETTSRSTLMQLIANAGGVLPNRGNIAYILRNAEETLEEEGETVERLLREGADIPREDAAVEELLTRKAQLRVDLSQLLDRGDMNRDVALETGDVVYIPLEKELDLAGFKIYVEGQVRSPGVYDFQPGLTTLNAVLMAGGFARYAAPSRTRIIRGTAEGQETIRVDLDAVRKGRTGDVSLRPGDLVNVPESWF